MSRTFTTTTAVTTALTARMSTSSTWSTWSTGATARMRRRTALATGWTTTSARGTRRQLAILIHTAISPRKTAATTAASNGSVNNMHDSLTPLGGLIPMWLMQLGEVVFGGVGSGLYGMLMFVIVAVFVAGLMVGRTPEYLGKKIEPFEMKMASIAVLVPCGLVLLGTAAVVLWPGNPANAPNPGAHGFSAVVLAA